MTAEPAPRTTERTKVARRLVPAVHCRIFGHAWDYTTVRCHGRELIKGLRCLRSSTERFVHVDSRTGARVSNQYAYPEHYQLSGGQFTSRERDAVRLAEIRRHLRRRNTSK